MNLQPVLQVQVDSSVSVFLFCFPRLDFPASKIYRAALQAFFMITGILHRPFMSCKSLNIFSKGSFSSPSAFLALQLLLENKLRRANLICIDLCSRTELTAVGSAALQFISTSLQWTSPYMYLCSIQQLTTSVRVVPVKCFES